jgi:hypothetical protein
MSRPAAHDDGLRTTPTPQEWADRIARRLAATVAAVVATGEELIRAKEALPHGAWGQLFHGGPDVERPLRLSERSAQMHMRVARHPVLANPHHGAVLPVSWRTLAELATLPAELVLEAMRDGRIRPDMERREVEALRRLPPGAPMWPTVPPPGAEAEWREIERLQQAAELLRQRAAERRAAWLAAHGSAAKPPAPTGPLATLYAALIADGCERCEGCNAYHHPGKHLAPDRLSDWERTGDRGWWLSPAYFAEPLT